MELPPCGPLSSYPERVESFFFAREILIPSGRSQSDYGKFAI